MNRNFYIYKNRISSENIEDSSEGQGNPSDDYSKLSSENQKKVDEIWRKIGKLESAYGLRKLSKAGNKALNSKVKKQNVHSIPDTFDEYDDFSPSFEEEYDEPRSKKLSEADKFMESPEYEQQEESDHRKYEKDRKRVESY
jgi:hypothetical protein